MIGQLTFLLERQETVARTLIGSWPGIAEMQLRASCFHSRHELAPGTWVRTLMPTLTEVGVRSSVAERFEEILEFGGRSFDHLPLGMNATVEKDLRGNGLLRRYLETRTSRLFASPAVAALPLGEFRKRFENAVSASDDNCCAKTLSQVRAEMRRFVAGGGDPMLFLAQLGKRAHQRREDFRLDAHLPASFRIISDIIIAIRDDMRAIPSADAQEACRALVNAFLDEREPLLDGLGARVASVAALYGFHEAVDRLMNTYRDESYHARTAALAAPSHELMMKIIYDAIPIVLAADMLAKMMKQLRGEKKYDSASRSTDEEFVRFSTALSIRCWTMIRPGDLRHQHLLQRARAKGKESVDALIEHWRGGLVFPDAILDRMRASVSYT
jgi:hypothetical protein